MQSINRRKSRKMSPEKHPISNTMQKPIWKLKQLTPQNDHEVTTF